MQAVLEGVAYGLRDSAELLHQTGVSDLEQVLVSGGGSPLEARLKRAWESQRSKKREPLGHAGLDVVSHGNTNIVGSGEG